jgi:hypothetical protein
MTAQRWHLGRCADSDAVSAAWVESIGYLEWRTSDLVRSAPTG